MYEYDFILFGFILHSAFVELNFASKLILRNNEVYLNYIS